MDKLLQLVLEADDDADLSAAVEHFYVLGPGLKKEFCAILKALKADGLVVSCSDAPRRSQTCSEMSTPRSVPIAYRRAIVLTSQRAHVKTPRWP